jgi:hypothetical protein
MLFLIDYQRHTGKIVAMRAFDDSQRRSAYGARFELERLRNQEGTDHEVVLLEATDEQVIRRTHSRYFETQEESVSVPDTSGESK